MSGLISCSLIGWIYLQRHKRVVPQKSSITHWKSLNIITVITKQVFNVYTGYTPICGVYTKLRQVCILPGEYWGVHVRFLHNFLIYGSISQISIRLRKKVFIKEWMDTYKSIAHFLVFPWSGWVLARTHVNGQISGQIIDLV